MIFNPPHGSALGATPAPLPGGVESGVVFNGRPQWEAFVKQHGGLITHIPRGPLKGELAASYGGRFVLAPLAIRNNERATIASEQADIAAGAEADRMLKLVKDTVGTIRSGAVNAAKGAVHDVADVAGSAGKDARHALGDVLGIPSWLIPVALVGVGVLVIRAALPTVPGIIARRYGGR